MNTLDKVKLQLNRLQDGNEIGVIYDVLVQLENIKYEVSAEIGSLTLTLMGKRKETLNSLVGTNDGGLKKVLSSSTLTKQYVDLELGEEQIKLDAKIDLLRNIRGSVDSVRSLLSTAKDMAKII
jgi:hypothetical protein